MGTDVAILKRLKLELLHHSALSPGHLPTPEMPAHPCPSGVSSQQENDTRSRCQSTDEWMMRRWCIYTVEFYSTIQRWNCVNFRKWVDLKIILSNISQTQKDKHCIFLLIFECQLLICFKELILCVCVCIVSLCIWSVGIGAHLCQKTVLDPLELER